MREIKFRAWDKEKEEMFEPEYFIQDGKGEGVLVHNSHARDGRYELMQYIGLKDKNGKEIFEGDIVKVWRDGSCRVFTVKWREEGVPMYILYPQPLHEVFWNLRSDMSISTEVIGNIYENPELLEVQ